MWSSVILSHPRACFYSAAVFLSGPGTARGHGCACRALFHSLSGGPSVSSFPSPFTSCRPFPHGPPRHNRPFSRFPVSPHASPAPARRVPPGACEGAEPPAAPPSAYRFLTATPRPLQPIGCPRLAPRLPPRGTRLSPHWPPSPPSFA